MYFLKSFLLITFLHLTSLTNLSLAGEDDASVAPAGSYLFRFYPKLYLTSAFFSDKGRSLNRDDITMLIYIESPLHVQYGLTKTLSIGGILPLGYTYEEVNPSIREKPISRIALREIWLTVQHRWLTVPFVAASSLRLKLPLASKTDQEDGLRIGDGQIDIYPAYLFSYYSKKRYWYTNIKIGYKYRFKKDELKPFDELNLNVVTGYELIPEFQLRFFILADLTAFRNGDFTALDSTEFRFFHNEGSLHTWGYGISLWPRPTLRLELVTAGDWSGRNQFRGIRWMVGIVKIN